MRVHSHIRTRFIITLRGEEESRHVTLLDAFTALRGLPSPRLPRSVFCVVIHRDQTEEILQEDLAPLAWSGEAAAAE